MRYKNWLFVAVVGVSCLTAGNSLYAQQYNKPPEPKSMEETGTVEGVTGAGVQLKNVKSEIWNIAIVPGKSTVAVTGTAAPEYLRAGLTVKFTAEIDGTGAMQGEISELEIFTPAGKNSLGIFATGGDEDAKPIKKLEAGTFDIKGKVATYKDGTLTVVAGGKKISGKVASEPKIGVNLSDITAAQVGDKVTAKIWYTDQTKAEAGKKPGQGQAESVSIELATPLAPAKKGRPAKGPAKEKDKKPASPFDN